MRAIDLSMGEEERTHADEAMERELLSESDNLRQHSRHVLVIEDDEPMAEYLALILDEALPGVEVHLFEKGEDARQEILRTQSAPWWKRHYDLIIIDVFLKGRLNGVDVWNLCRINFPNSKIIFTSSLSKESYCRMVSDVSPTPPFLQKPFRKEQCLDMIREALGLYGTEV